MSKTRKNLKTNKHTIYHKENEKTHMEIFLNNPVKMLDGANNQTNDMFSNHVYNSQKEFKDC